MAAILDFTNMAAATPSGPNLVPLEESEPNNLHNALPHIHSLTTSIEQTGSGTVLWSDRSPENRLGIFLSANLHDKSEVWKTAGETLFPPSSRPLSSSYLSLVTICNVDYPVTTDLIPCLLRSPPHPLSLLPCKKQPPSPSIASFNDISNSF